MSEQDKSRMTETTTVAHFAVAEAMRLELDKHHQWDDPSANGPIKGCGHSRLAPYDFEKMADAVLRLPGVVLMSEWTLRKVYDALSHNCPALLEGELCPTCVTRQEVSASLAAYMVARIEKPKETP